MAWDEWEHLKSQHATGGPGGIQLNQLAPDSGGGGTTPGDLKVSQQDLAAGQPVLERQVGLPRYRRRGELHPVVGDAAQRGVDALTYQWQTDEQARIGQENRRQNGETFSGRENQLRELTKIWMETHPGEHSGQNQYLLEDEINGAAFDGNSRARGLSGDQ